MEALSYTLRQHVTKIYPGSNFSKLENLVPKDQTVLIIDQNVFDAYNQKFAGWKTICIPAGEASKQQSTINEIIESLISFEADRSSWLVGVGGGVATDICGYVASIYMRGIRFGFVPTTLLAMVDASLGGKNGIDVKVYKNLLGTINQPVFILHDHQFLSSLPKAEWINGMAEVIKHACIAKADLFESLEQNSLESIMSQGVLLNGLISINVKIKMAIVQNDELETGERKLLNFGHTFGHAIETLAKIPHGQAISIGMAMAGKLSMSLSDLPADDYQRLLSLLKKYNLPIETHVPIDDILELVKLDKKRAANEIDLVLLKSIGSAVIKRVAMADLKNLLD